MDEIWKPVPSRKGVVASSLGRIQLPPQVREMPKGGQRVYTTIPRYGSICSSKSSKSYQFRGVRSQEHGAMKVHRLVCEAFHGPAPSPQHVVIHLNEDSLDNRPENLRWGTQKENMNMPKFIAYCRSRTGADSPASKGKARKAGV